MPSSIYADGPDKEPGRHVYSLAITLEEQWPALAHAIETEICQPIDTANADGMADPSFVGRARR